MYCVLYVGMVEAPLFKGIFQRNLTRILTFNDRPTLSMSEYEPLLVL
jgi:hypothetical protein